MRAFPWIALLALAGCGNRTFVVVELSAAAGLPAIATIDLSATFGTRTQTTTLRDPSGTLTLPTSAAIEIKSGSGMLSATATANDSSGNVVATAMGSVAVSSGQTAHLPLMLGSGSAFDMGGENDMSTPADMAAHGPAPTGLNACPASTVVRLTYAVPTGATAINVYYGTTSGVTKATGVKVTASLTPPFAVTGLTNGTTYYFVATAAGADGVESGESSEVSATPAAAVHDTLFVPSAGSSTLDIWDCASKLPNGSGPTRTLNNAAINNPQYGSVAVDGPRAIIYLNISVGTILVWDDATNVNGGAAPNRTITGSWTNRGIAVDTIHKRLYVNASSPGAETLVYTNSDTLNGAAPAATATITGLGGLNQLFVDLTNDRLYIANNSNVLAFTSASSLSGSVAASGALNWTISGASGLYFGVSIDANIMYVAFYNPGAIMSVANITAQASGSSPMPATNLTAAAHGGPLSVVGNVMYFAPDNDPMNRVFVYNNASTATSTAQPDKVFVTTHTSLDQALYVP